MDFIAEFEQVAKQMKIDFERARRISGHPGLRGDSAESVLRVFLSEYLPKNLEIITGQIFDSEGRVSNQLDIIICAKNSTPTMFLDREHKTRLVPVECVYAVIEVKSFLNKSSLTGRTGIFKNMESVRALKKKAYYPEGVIQTAITNNYGKEWSDWPINYFVFSFDSIKLETLINHIDNYHKTEDKPPEKRIDSVCVLGKGMVLNKHDDGKFSACPDDSSVLVHSYTSKELLLFYTLVSHFLLQARMRKFKFIDYIQGVRFD